MAEWIGALVPAYLVVWLLQLISKKWRKRLIPLAAAHAASLVICVLLWIWGGSGEGKTSAQLVTMGLLVYLPPQLFWLAVDFGTRNKTAGFLRGPSRSIPSKAPVV